MEKKKKALLLLTGGRGVPDMLTVKGINPDYVFNLTTKQGLAIAQSLQEFVRNKFGCNMEILPTIDPYNEQEIKEACRKTISSLPDAEWIMHITSSPKVVGIYAHDIAREYNIPCWFLDTDGKQVVSLVRKAETSLDYEKLFQANVEEYMGSYGRTYEIPKSLAYRNKAESWFGVAQILAQEPEMTQIFIGDLRRNNNSFTPKISAHLESFLEQLATLGVLNIIKRDIDGLKCSSKDNDVLEFLKGDWLEVYVWTEALKAGFADDCKWGYKIVADLPANELDLALTYKARLLIAECKTSGKPFETDHLYKLHSVADLVGGNYVRQVFITNYPRPTVKNEQFDNFCEQAKIRRITVITGEQLRDVGTLLREQIGIAGRSK